MAIGPFIVGEGGGTVSSIELRFVETERDCVALCDIVEMSLGLDFVSVPV